MTAARGAVGFGAARRAGPDTVLGLSVLLCLGWLGRDLLDGVVTWAPVLTLAGVALLTLLSWRTCRLEPGADRPTPLWWPILVLCASGGAAALWCALRDGEAGFAAGLAVLVAAGPASVRAAGPGSMLLTRRAASSAGVRLPDPTTLERVARLDHVILDKHRTVTTGEMRINSVEPLDPDHRRTLLWFAGAVSHGSTTPVASALARQTARGRLTDFAEVPGHGMTGAVDRHPVRVGDPGWLGMVAPASRGVTVAVEVDERPLGLITVEDVVRPGAKETIAGLGSVLSVQLISDDTPANTAALAADLGLDTATVLTTAAERREAVAAAQTAGRVVAFAGGLGGCQGALNQDALELADLAITDAAATERPRGMVLQQLDVDSVVDAIAIARGASGRARRTHQVAVALSCVSVVVAVTGLLAPAAAVALAALHPVVVGYWAQRLVAAPLH